MINQILSDDEHQRRYAEAIRESRQAGNHEFQSWFNRSQDLSQSIHRGYWDLSFHILTRKVCQFLENPEEKTALEIGYGGDRILNAACNYFNEAIGIDIHEEQESVKEIPEAPVNHTSLVIRVGKVKALSRKYGFKILETGTSYKTMPDGYDSVVGGQNYVTLRKLNK